MDELEQLAIAITVAHALVILFGLIVLLALLWGSTDD